MRLPLTLITVACFSAVCIAIPPGVGLHWDPDHPNPKSATIWLYYLMVRTDYRRDHQLPQPASGELVPSFDEEVYARQAAVRNYRVLKAKDKNFHDGYWETLEKVEANGFIRPYVWVYLHRSVWPKTEQPKNLSAFENWRRSALKSHHAETFGSLSADQSRGVTLRAGSGSR